MKNLKLIPLAISLLLFSCISTLETAKVSKGMNAGFKAELVNLNIKDRPETIDPSNLNCFALTGKITKGYEWKIPFEIGFSPGVYSKPDIRVLVDRSAGTNDFRYFPYEKNATFYATYFTKLQVYKSNDIYVSLRPEMYKDKFHSGTIIVSKEDERSGTYLTAKILNRFIPSAEEKVDNSKIGYYFGIGKKLTISKYRSGSPFSFLGEVGLAKNIWYNDRVALVVSIGMSIK